jgi:DNA-binding transcriptional ArsR family regulator
MNDRPSAFISTMIESTVSDVLQALGDPVRLAIVRGLVGGERACGTFTDLGVSASTRSHHFAVLREAGVIETRAEGKQRISKLRRADLDERYPGLLDAVLGSR